MSDVPEIRASPRPAASQNRVRNGPLVSVVLLSSGRPEGRLAAALRSVTQQTYANLEVLVVGRGERAALAAVAAAAGDGRVTVLPAPAGPGKAAALNDALARAGGMYVCYLCDDDLFHPDHVQTLAGALEGPTDSRAAYADVYRTICRAGPGGRREVLGKVLREARDFDPFFLLHRNHIPLTALMHRRDLIARAGAFRTDLRAMVEWDFLRRLAFFTDFLHVPAVTAEMCTDDEDADRDRDVDVDGQPLGPEELAAEACKVRAAHPAKPWPRMQDLAIILAPAEDEQADLPARIAEIRRTTAVPHTLYLAVADTPGKPDAEKAEGDLVRVPVQSHWPWDARVGKALVAAATCQGDCVAILPQCGWLAAPRITQAWYALTRHAGPNEGLLLKPSRPTAWGAVFRIDELRRARARRPALTIRRSAEADGITLRMPAPAELPFAFDQAMKQAQVHETDGNFAQAVRIYLGLAESGTDTLWTGQAAAAALYHEPARWQEALAACRQVNLYRPTVATLLLEARLCRSNHHADQAAELLERARGLLDWAADTID